MPAAFQRSPVRGAVPGSLLGEQGLFLGGCLLQRFFFLNGLLNEIL